MRTKTPDRDHHLARWHASGLSRSAYCQQTGLSYQTFYGWTKSRAQVSPPNAASDGGFIEMPRTAPPATVAPASAVSIHLTCGTSLHVHHGAEPTWVGQLAAAVRRC